MAFPETIDERIFFSDADYSQNHILKEYQQLYNDGQYSNATKLLRDSGINYFGASLLTSLEDQIVMIENYINNSDNESFMKIMYPIPPNLKTGDHWISAKEDFSILTEYASDLSELYTNNPIGLVE